MFFRSVLLCLGPTVILGLGGCTEPPDITQLETSVNERSVRLSPTLANTSFGQAVAASVTESPAFGRSQAALRESEADLMAEDGLRLPQLSVGLRQGAGTGFSVTPFAALSQVVFDAGAGKARKRAAEARLVGSKASRTDAASIAALDAVETWTEVVIARKALAAVQGTISELELIVARIETRSAGGASSDTDLLTARGRMATEQIGLAEARSRVSKAEAIFAEVFGATPPADLSLPPAAPPLPSTDIMSSPVMQQAEAERLAAQADLAAATSGLLPAIGIQVSGTPDSDPVAGVSANQTIAPATGRTSRVTVAEARLQARVIDQEAVRRELVRRLRLIAADQVSASERYATARAATVANLANLASASQQFDIGARSLIELLDAQREASTSEQQRIMAEKDRIVLGYEALAVTGDILALFDIRI